MISKFTDRQNTCSRDGRLPSPEGLSITHKCYGWTLATQRWLMVGCGALLCHSRVGLPREGIPDSGLALVTLGRLLQCTRIRRRFSAGLAPYVGDE
jgi:hypothetical protein